MPAWLLPVLSLVARPLGQLINNALTAGAAAFVAWSTAKGLPLDSANSIAGMVIAVISSLISSAAASQGVTIPVINADTNNGVRVVAVDAARKANLPPQDTPLPH